MYVTIYLPVINYITTLNITLQLQSIHIAHIGIRCNILNFNVFLIINIDVSNNVVAAVNYCKITTFNRLQNCYCDYTEYVK